MENKLKNKMKKKKKWEKVRTENKCLGLYRGYTNIFFFLYQSYYFW